MPHRVAQNVSSTPEHAAFLAGLDASGRHAGVSGIVRAALDALARRETRRVARGGGEADAGRA